MFEGLQVFYQCTKSHPHSSFTFIANKFFLLNAYIISHYIGNWIKKKKKGNKKKVVARVVDFLNFDIQYLGNRMSDSNNFFSVPESVD